jgi:gluconolactonase
MRINRSKFQFLFTVILIIFTLNNAAIGAEKASGLIAPGAVLKKVQSGFKFTEGPTTDSDGNVYFTDVQAERIYKWNCADGMISLYRENTGRANGLLFDAKGRLVVCEMGNGRVALDDMKGNIKVLADSYKGKSIMPNDLWIDSKGGIYFSDFIMSAESSGTQENYQVYYISPDFKNITRMTEDLVLPNGLIGTPDGKMIYIADIKANKTWQYKINSDGTLTEKKLFCEQGSDGVKLDEKNNLYLTTDKAVVIYNPTGQKIEEIAVPERFANMTFGGKDRKTLFIAAPTSVYTIEMTVRGSFTPLDLAKGRIEK